MRKHRFYSIALLCFVMCGMLIAQPRGQQMQPRFVFFETVLMPSDNEGITRLNLNYRIMKNFFVFTRTSAAGGDYEFEGGYELNIEIFDAQGQSRAREIKQERLFRNTATIEFPDIEYIEGGFSFDLPEGEYRFLIRLNDRNSQRRYTDRDSRITISSYRESEPGIYDILFVEPHPTEDAPDTIRPVNLGGNLFFGKRADGIILFKTPPDITEAPAVIVRVQKSREGQRTPEEIFIHTIKEEHILSGKRIRADAEDEDLLYAIRDTDDADYHIAFFRLPSETFEEGSYRIHTQVEYRGKIIEHSKTFSVQWMEKPASLRNIDFAVEMLEYIMSPEEYRNLRRGSADERRRKFLTYWKEKDPDPQTAYNPVKTEFYRRVDHAAREFTSLREQNGARTDRGKIYILYGPPTSKDRSLIPGQAPQETWIYRHLNQKFIFVDQSRQGNYRLTTREEL